jgi:twitching motility protein PilT
VILFGEMRDLESIQNAITLAETGHLVLSTIHSQSAAQTISKIIDIFPPEQQNQIRIQLADSLSAVIYQRLLKKMDGT